jgi:hypothetical protein
MGRTKQRAATAILAAAVPLAGCVSDGKTFDERYQQVIAAPPNYRALILAHLKNTLKDPYSVRSAEISDASPKFVGLLNGGNRPAVCVKMNAKNSFGAYIGIQTHAYFFLNNEIAGAIDNAIGCNEAKFAPFTEIMSVS